jgi:nucleoside-diphosphate-sugar epimerase
MINECKIFLLSNNNAFSKHIDECLKSDSLESDLGVVLPTTHEPDIVIINLLNLDEKLELQIDEVLKSRIKKIILIENALDIYLNSKNSLPFSVYSKVVPKNEICERILAIEKKIAESRKQYVIFRVSEIYGISVPDSLVEKLLFVNSGEFENSVRDFIYDGDVVSAIEVALRKEVSGVFDIASGKSVELKKLVELIKQLRRIEEFDITWRRKKLEVVFNCDNFKFYKWEPLVDLEVGLKTLLTFRRNYVKLPSARNSCRKNF